jgi:hypothetical protein
MQADKKSSPLLTKIKQTNTVKTTNVSIPLNSPNVIMLKAIADSNEKLSIKKRKLAFAPPVITEIKKSSVESSAGQPRLPFEENKTLLSALKSSSLISSSDLASKFNFVSFYFSLIILYIL